MQELFGIPSDQWISTLRKFVKAAIIGLFIWGGVTACGDIIDNFYIEEDEDNTSESAAMEEIEYKSGSPAIKITDIRFDTATETIEYDFENISEKDISNIIFETYFYDKYGHVINLENNDANMIRFSCEGTVPKNATDTVTVTFTFTLPDDTAVVFPKCIKVLFSDNTTSAFYSSLYAYSADYQGGNL